MYVSWLSFTLFLNCFLLLFVCVPSDSQDVDFKTLKQVHVLYRHGDRAPIHPYPNLKDNFEWPFGYGQLTLDGLRMLQRLGLWMRQRYDGFILRHWNSTEIQVITSDIDRTINSALASLQGFYSRRDSNMQFDPTLNWSPVPIRPIPIREDALIIVDAACPRVEEEKKKLDDDPRIKAVTIKCIPLFKLLTEKLGQDVKTIQDIDFAHDYFHIHVMHNVPIPDWIKPHLPFMKLVSDFAFQMLAYNTELKKLRGSPLIKKIIDEMELKISNESQTKLFMYSAHDSTVAVNLNTLGVFNNLAPPYAATVIYELHQINNEYVIKIFYRNDTEMIHPPIPMTVPGCTEICPLAKFKDLMHPIIPANYTLECKSTLESENENTLYGIKDTLANVKEAFKHNENVYMALTVTLLLMVTIMSILIITWKRRLAQIQAYSLLSQG